MVWWLLYLLILPLFQHINCPTFLSHRWARSPLTIRGVDHSQLVKLDSNRRKQKSCWNRYRYRYSWSYVFTEIQCFGYTVSETKSMFLIQNVSNILCSPFSAFSSIYFNRSIQKVCFYFWSPYR